MISHRTCSCMSYFYAWLKIKQVYALACRNLQKEVDSYQNKVERKTAQSDYSRDDNVCEICHKTKFADGSGKECKYCKLKVCARCGAQVTIPGSKQVNFCEFFKRFQLEKMLKDSIVISIHHSHVFLFFQDFLRLCRFYYYEFWLKFSSDYSSFETEIN